jgi:hypothetical protein
MVFGWRGVNFKEKRMSKIGESLLKGANEALSYVKGHKKGVKWHRIKIPMDINLQEVGNELYDKGLFRLRRVYKART